MASSSAGPPKFFDFFVYAIASVLVFPKLVFPYLDPLTGTLYSFAIFSLAFIARPIGTMIFTAIDRSQGKGAKLTIALFLLGVATVAIAFLPGHESIGVASAWLLAAARIGQGISWGGTWDGLASLLALNAPEGKKGWYAMIPQLGAPIGLAGGERAVRLLRRHACPLTTSSTGAGAIRSSLLSPSMSSPCSRACAWW